MYNNVYSVSICCVYNNDDSVYSINMYVYIHISKYNCILVYVYIYILMCGWGCSVKVDNKGHNYEK